MSEYITPTSKLLQNKSSHLTVASYIMLCCRSGPKKGRDAI